ncbi:unnamed protein product, partial [Discosporangium mesarthrocarpum]
HCHHRKTLVVGADALSRWVDWEDRNSCILFGDGAGALVLEAADDVNDSGVLGEEGCCRGRVEMGGGRGRSGGGGGGGGGG